MSVFRTQYRDLSDLEKLSVARIKAQAEQLYALLNDAPGDPRAKSLAKTKLEECVMWATKGITG